MTQPNPNPGAGGPSYRGRRLDGPVDEFHRAMNLLRWDTIPEASYQARQQRHAQIAREPGPLRLVVCGAREWTDRDLLAATLARVVAEHACGRPVVVIEGDARGADRLAADIARGCGWQVEAYPADWRRYGRSAGPRRNALMLRAGQPERVVAFTDDLTASPGTADLVRRAQAAGLPVLVVGHPTREEVSAPAPATAVPQLPL